MHCSIVIAWVLLASVSVGQSPNEGKELQAYTEQTSNRLVLLSGHWARIMKEFRSELHEDFKITWDGQLSSYLIGTATVMHSNARQELFDLDLVECRRDLDSANQAIALANKILDEDGSASARIVWVESARDEQLGGVATHSLTGSGITQRAQVGNELLYVRRLFKKVYRDGCARWPSISVGRNGRLEHDKGTLVEGIPPAAYLDRAEDQWHKLELQESHEMLARAYRVASDLSKKCSPQPRGSAPIR